MSERAQLVCIIAALVAPIPFVPLPWVLGAMRLRRAERAAELDGAATWWDPSW